MDVISLDDFRENGADRGTAEEHFVLPVGTPLLYGQYTITQFVDQGGFGITYKATDSLGRSKAIKECFPEAFCIRVNRDVRVRQSAHEKDQKRFVERFLKEAHRLAGLSHPNIVHVHDVFEENNTAYLSMDFINGVNLFDLIAEEPQRLTPRFVMEITRKLLDAIGYIHGKGVLHRDISPDNVLIDEVQAPILVDFGSAREEVKSEARVKSVMQSVKDGYSPPEFYVSSSDQGPSSDLYSLGATLYHVISGKIPPDSQKRLADKAAQLPDPYVPLKGRFNGYPDQFLAAIDRSLAVLPKDRFPEAQAWLAELQQAKRPSPAPVPRPQKPRRTQQPIAPVTDRPQRAEAHRTTTRVPVAEGRDAGSPGTDAKPKADPPETVARTQIVAPSKRKSSAPLVGMVAVGAIVAGAAGYFTLGGGSTPLQPAVDSVAVAEPAPAPAQTAEPTVAQTDLTAATPTPVQITDATPEALTDVATNSAEKDVAPAEAAEPVISLDAVVPLPTAENVAATEPIPAALTEEIAPIVQDVAATLPEYMLPSGASILAPTAHISAAPMTEADNLSQDMVRAIAVLDPGIGFQIFGPLTDLSTLEVGALPDTTPAVAYRLPTPRPSFMDISNLPIAANQVSYSHWDIYIPFASETRQQRNASTIEITEILDAEKARGAGSWLAVGDVIYAINGKVISDERVLSVHLLTQLAVDPDGNARFSMTFKSATTGKLSRELMVLPVFREIGLADGTVLTARTEAGAWFVEVKEPSDTARELRAGDVLLGEKNTGLSIISHQDLERVFRLLVAKEHDTARFELRRGGRTLQADVPLGRTPNAASQTQPQK